MWQELGFIHTVLQYSKWGRIIVLHKVNAAVWSMNGLALLKSIEITSYFGFNIIDFKRVTRTRATRTEPAGFGCFFSGFIGFGPGPGWEVKFQNPVGKTR